MCIPDALSQGKRGVERVRGTSAQLCLRDISTTLGWKLKTLTAQTTSNHQLDYRLNAWPLGSEAPLNCSVRIIIYDRCRGRVRRRRRRRRRRRYFRGRLCIDHLNERTPIIIEEGERAGGGGREGEVRDSPPSPSAAMEIVAPLPMMVTTTLAPSPAEDRARPIEIVTGRSDIAADVAASAS